MRDGIQIVDQYLKLGHERCKHWLFRVWDPRRRSYKSKAFDKKEDGWLWSTARRARFELRQDGSGRVSLADLGVEYLEELAARGTGIAHRNDVKRIIDGAVAAGAIDLRADGFPSKVRHYLANLENETRPGKALSIPSRNRYLGHMKAVCQFAVRSRYIEFDPLVIIEPAKEPDSIKKTYRLEEMRTLTADRDDPFWLPFCLMAYTGCRYNEALHLRWEWINWSERRVEVRRHPDYKLKGDKERSMPLQPELGHLLAILPSKRDVGWIVEDKVLRQTDGRNQWEKMVEYLDTCKVERHGRAAHSTRHTWVAMMLAGGENEIQVRDWAGHEDLETTSGYAKTQEAYRASVRSWPRGRLCFRSPSLTELLVLHSKACDLVIKLFEEGCSSTEIAAAVAAAAVSGSGDVPAGPRTCAPPAATPPGRSQALGA